MRTEPPLRSAPRLPIRLAIGFALLACALSPGMTCAPARAQSSEQPAVTPAPLLEAQSPSAPRSAAGKATLPLSEILALYRDADAARAPGPGGPPVRGAVQRAELHATLLEDAIEVEAHWTVSVLAEDEQWTAVELLRVSETTHLSALPSVPAGMLALREGALVFLTRKADRYAIDLRFVERAAVERDQRAARVALPRSAPAELRVRFASDLFRLAGPSVRRDARGARILPQDGAFEVRWLALEREAPRPASGTEAPTAADPSIPRAHASAVATLEGECITRIAYALQFSGRRALSFAIPPGETVQRAVLNGRALPLSIEERRLTLELTPARVGGEGGELELVLSRELPGFLLSGRLQLTLPAPEWPTHELALDVHLPDVFAYAWAGGSLSPVEDLPPQREYLYDIPTPGRRLRFHQYLLRSSAPDLSLRYTVELEGRYFRR